ncbi:DinB family protein [Thalassobacillus pellis]|uniref:DinB family protein n=1 Tax=Thalassobacillus pellis TaxID=748008 RepID=UPI001960544A|nr:DinB family protein [Thalassobacillus pellis]MBM7551869.1 hypothetical protein [Thalassobacillus pellis]
MAIWIDSLRELEKQQLFAEIQPGKWSIGALAAHFMYWDRFVLENRLLPYVENRSVPVVEVSEQEVNEAAEVYAHSGVEQEELIDQVIAKRLEVITMLEKIPEKHFSEPFQLLNKSVHVADYIKGLTEHDIHHKKNYIIHGRERLVTN